MKQHKIIMRPMGCNITKMSGLIPENAKWIGCITEAGLIGTMTRDGLLYKGPLAEDETLFIEEVAHQLLENEQLLTMLETGKVHKRLAAGTIEYDIKAKLVIACQPFEPSERVKAVFEIMKYEPSYVISKTANIQ